MQDLLTDTTDSGEVTTEETSPNYSGEHDNPLDVADVGDARRADMLAEYVGWIETEFGKRPNLMPLDSEGKGPIITGRCSLDSAEADRLLVTADEGIRRIREEGARGFAIYAGRPSHNTGDVAFTDHDDTEAFPSPVATPTLEVLSGSGRGTHETHRNDTDDPVRNARVGDNYGEIRAENWYVVAPGSIHPSGGVYHMIEDRPISTIADSDLSDRERPVSPTTGSTTTNTGEPNRTLPEDIRDPDGGLADTEQARLHDLAEDAHGEFLADEDTTERAKKYLQDLLDQEYGDRDRSEAELIGTGLFYGVLIEHGDGDNLTPRERVALDRVELMGGGFPDRAAAVYAYVTEAHAGTGKASKWNERDENWRTGIVEDAINTFDLGIWETWREKPENPDSGLYSDKTMHATLKAIHQQADEDTREYPTGKEVADMAADIDADYNSEKSYKNAAGRLQRDHGMVRMAEFEGGDNVAPPVYYPKDYPDPEDAVTVYQDGHGRTPGHDLKPFVGEVSRS